MKLSGFVEILRNPPIIFVPRWRRAPALEPSGHLRVVVLLLDVLEVLERLRDLLDRDRVLDTGIVLLGGPGAEVPHDHADDGDRHTGIHEYLPVGAPALAEVHIYTDILGDLVGVHPDGVARKVSVRRDGAEEQRPSGRADGLDMLRSRDEVSGEERVRIRADGCLLLKKIITKDIFYNNKKISIVIDL